MKSGLMNRLKMAYILIKLTFFKLQPSFKYINSLHCYYL